MAQRNRRTPARRRNATPQRARAARRRGAAARTAELALAAPQVVALRTARMLAAGSNPGARDRREMARMSAEKMQAAQASLLAMGAQMYRTNVAWTLRAAQAWWTAWLFPLSWMRHPGTLPGVPWAAGAPGRRALHKATLQLVDKGLGPIHAAATANLRRLSGKHS